MTDTKEGAKPILMSDLLNGLNDVQAAALRAITTDIADSLRPVIHETAPNIDSTQLVGLATVLHYFQTGTAFNADAKNPIERGEVDLRQVIEALPGELQNIFRFLLPKENLNRTPEVQQIRDGSQKAHPFDTWQPPEADEVTADRNAMVEKFSQDLVRTIFTGTDFDWLPKWVGRSAEFVEKEKEWVISHEAILDILPISHTSGGALPDVAMALGIAIDNVENSRLPHSANGLETVVYVTVSSLLAILEECVIQGYMPEKPIQFIV